MTLEDYRADMLRCTRCSYCKWIPIDQIKSWQYSRGCPSIEYNKFQPYSAGGRLSAALSLLEGRSSYTPRFLDIAYKCLLCGSCDVACKVCRYDMEPLQAMRELRFKMNADGQCLPQHRVLVESLQKNNNPLQKTSTGRGKWAEGLKVKDLTREKAEVVFHAGCRFSYDEEIQHAARSAVSLLLKAGVDVGIMGEAEMCCGGRVNDMGYRSQMKACAERNIDAWTRSGSRTIVTSCADCYYAIKRLYPELGSSFEVLHTVELLDRLIKEGRLTLNCNVPLKVTYHDPCHLGRQGEPYVPWKGKEKKIRGQIVVYDPPRPRYNGARGIYEPPREILKSIPGLSLVEMERNKEYAWCCGAGGGVREAYPDFSAWTAAERIKEARSTGAEAIISACPGCERNFIDAVKTGGLDLKVLDIVEIVWQAVSAP
ncbi:MAG: (Fe-S)-binding protein [Dehalococcoidales bacterium]|nr:(Fe-S)-binding protein [Dehalococcoidales bacterium]